MSEQVTTLEEYQLLALRTVNTSLSAQMSLANYGMGLAGEAGETCDHLKKVVFHGHDLDRDSLKKELGDVLWYVAVIAAEINLTLTEVATANIDKLRRRYPEGFSEQASRERSGENGRSDQEMHG